MKKATTTIKALAALLLVAGMNWNAALEAGGVLVSEDIYINCEVQLVKQL